MPFFSHGVILLVKVADCAGTRLGASECFGDVLNAPEGYSGQAHFYQGLFDGSFSSSVRNSQGSTGSRPMEKPNA